MDGTIHITNFEAGAPFLLARFNSTEQTGGPGWTQLSGRLCLACSGVGGGIPGKPGFSMYTRCLINSGLVPGPNAMETFASAHLT